MATIAQKIADLTGSDMSATLVSSYEATIRNAFNFVIDIIPSTSELWHHTNTLVIGPITTDFYTVSNRRILSVKRRDSSNGQFYSCRELSLKEGLKIDDVNSIFYSIKGNRNPVFYMSENGKLIIRPTVNNTAYGEAYYASYITTTDISTQTTMSENSATQSIPETVIDLGCLRASILLLQARISNAVQDDEDTELLQLVQGQIASLNALFQEEAQRLNIPYKRMGVSDDIK
tara:strand:- start:32 stop:727 length:696 start_codon:yes stop_codon:yes gene_type:complete